MKNRIERLWMPLVVMIASLLLTAPATALAEGESSDGTKYYLG